MRNFGLFLAYFKDGVMVIQRNENSQLLKIDLQLIIVQLSMFVELDNQFRFPIPFNHVFLAEKQAIQLIHEYRLHNDKLAHQDHQEKRKQILGELKMSDRQTIIVLCYLLTCMSEAKSKSDQIPKTVFYLCKNEQRKQWLLRAIDKIMIFLEKQLSIVEERRHIRDIKIYDQSKDSQAKLEKEKTSLKFRRLFVLPISKYMALKLQIKEHVYWQNNPDPCIELQQSQSMTLLKYCKNIDYLFAQTNDLQGILEDSLSIWLSEVIINRAWMELAKLNKFYNFRSNNKLKEKAKSVKKPQVTEVQPLKKQLETPIEPKKEVDGQPQTKKKFIWRVQNYDGKFSQLIKAKKTQLQNKNHYARVDRSLPRYIQCYFLVHLQAITYIVSYLVCNSKEKQPNQNSDFQITTQQYISQVCKKINIPATAFRKYRRILKSFIEKYPPKVMDRQLQIYYTEQVLRFFEKVVIWQQIFGKGNQEDALANKFWVFKFKHEYEVQIALSRGSYCRRVKEQQYKLTTFDQKIMFQLFNDGVRSLSCYQNQGYCFDYYQQIFKPGKKMNVSIDYRCPTVVAKDMRSIAIGLIINSTPNDEDLHIHSDKPHWSLELNDVEDKKFDKQNYSQIIRSYGVLIYDLCEAVPDGIVVYFPNRQILRECRAQWESMESIYERIYQKKRIFEEVEDEKTNTQNLSLYRKLCDSGRGAVFFISAQSEFGKNKTFFNHYSRSILFVGVPYNPHSIQVEHRIKQLKLKQIFKFQIAMRNIARCLSNCINNPAEIKIVLFADASFGTFDIRKKWFPFIEEGNVNTSDVIEKVRRINSKTSSLLAQRRKQEEQLLLRREHSFTSLRQCS